MIIARRLGLRSLGQPAAGALRLAPLLAYLAIIFYLGGSSAPPSLGMTMSDKLQHLGGFGLLALLALPALCFELPHLGGRVTALLAIAFSSLVGALLEVYQGFCPPRTPELLDWVADTVGAGLALLGVLVLRQIWLRVSPAPAPSPSVDRLTP